MAKTGRFLHSVVNETDIAAVGTSYVLAKKHTFDLKVATSAGTANPFRAFMRSMFFRCTSIVGGAAKVTIRLCLDAAGDFTILGDTEVTLDLGITTATTGSGQILFDDYPFWEYINNTDTIYAFYKVDAGTATIDVAQINWSE